MNSERHPPMADEPRGPSFFSELRTEFLIHELKDPLSVVETGIRTLLERTDRFGPLSARQERTLQRVLRNACKAREMLYGLLEVGRSEAECYLCSRFEPAPAVVDAVCEAAAVSSGQLAERINTCPDRQQAGAVLAEAGVRMHVDAEADRLEVFQDETQFRQIVGNLVKNAFHHCRRTIDIRLQRQDDCLVLEVTDDGPGIRREHRQLIFRRYTQLQSDAVVKRRGHGLGLAGARILARGLGGDLAVAGAHHQGATFRLILPLHGPDAGGLGLAQK